MSKALLVAGVALVLGVVGCAAEQPSQEETQGSTSSKLLAPQPSVTSAASKETTAAYGITHWKMYRGKQNLVMTGFDKSGHAVKGVNIGFAKSADGNARLLTQIDDGSSFTAVHDFVSGQNLAPQNLSADSQQFLTALAGDATTIGQQFSALTGTAGSQCGSDMASVLTTALQCMGGSSSSASQAACVNAATTAANTATSCAGTGATSILSGATGTSGITGELGSVLSSLPSYTGGSPFDASAIESTIGSAVGGNLGNLGSLGGDLGSLGSLIGSNPFSSSSSSSASSCDISNPFGSGLSSILGSVSNGDCSFTTGGGSPFGSFSEGDLCDFGGFGGLLGGGGGGSGY